jgi:TRAP transporter TAXI family solute receptor
MVTQQCHRKVSMPCMKTILLLCTVLIITTGISTASAAELLFGSGPVGSFSHFTARAVCREISRATGEPCRVMPAPDGIHNLTNLQQGSLDIALVDGKLLNDAINRAGRFAFMDVRYGNISMLTPMYKVPILVIARRESGITELGQLAGRRINAGAPQTSVRQALDVIMTAKGWTRKDFKVFQELPATQSQDTMAFCHGDIEAMIHVGVHPDPRLQQLISLCTAEAVSTIDDDTERLIGTQPAFSSALVPGGTYGGGFAAVDAISTTTVLVASLSLDDATVSAILTVLADNQALLKSHPTLSGFSMSPSAGAELGLPRHPGAAAFLTGGTN